MLFCVLREFGERKSGKALTRNNTDEKPFIFYLFRPHTKRAHTHTHHPMIPIQSCSALCAAISVFRVWVVCFSDFSARIRISHRRWQTHKHTIQICSRIRLFEHSQHRRKYRIQKLQPNIVRAYCSLLLSALLFSFFLKKSFPFIARTHSFVCCNMALQYTYTETRWIWGALHMLSSFPIPFESISVASVALYSYTYCAAAAAVAQRICDIIHVDVLCVRDLGQI